jgi:ADP-heptose:LPS heptosyltransferase
MGGIGDILLLVPALRSLRARYPGAEILLICPGEVGKLLAECGEVDATLPGDDERLAALAMPALTANGDLAQTLGYPDLVVAFTRGGERAGQALRSAAVAAVCADPFPPTGQHAAAHALDVLRASHVSATSWEGPERVEPLNLGADLRHHTMDLGGGESVVMHPGAGAPWKRAPISLFRQLAGDLGARGLDVTFVYGPAESNSARQDSGTSWSETPSLSELAAALSRACLFIGNDSGVTHLAGILGTPTVALFGPTHPVTWRPLGPHVAVIRECSEVPGPGVRVCHNDECMEAIGIERVVDACLPLLRGRNISRGPSEPAPYGKMQSRDIH